MMDDQAPPLTKVLSLGVVALLVGVVAYAAVAPSNAGASHQPADRVAAAGASYEIMESATANGSFSEEHTLFSTQMRTSNPTDLVIQLTAECALWTDVTTVGNDESESFASVNVWVEIDGEPVPVSGEDDGVVTLCNREYRVQTTQFENENATIDRYLRSRQANAFNWIAVDAGADVHTVEVKAQLEGHAESFSEGNAHAKAVIGQRTLVIEPIKLAHDDL